MKKLLWTMVCVALLLLSCTLVAAAYPGCYCGGSKTQFEPAGNVEVVWDPDVLGKIDLRDGNMDDWENAGYPVYTIDRQNMVDWISRSDAAAAELTKNWNMEMRCVADENYLYLGMYIRDDMVVCVDDPYNYARGDTIQIEFDFGGIMQNAANDWGEELSSVSGVFYSFACRDTIAAPIEIVMQEASDYDGLISEAYGDNVFGSVALTEEGWCAEFALGWDLLLLPAADKAWLAEKFIVSEDHPLYISTLLSYINHDDDSSSASWAAATWNGAIVDGRPDLTWSVADMGMQLNLPYNPDLAINCDGIEVRHYAEDETVTPDWEDEWTTIMPEDETVVPDWEDEWPTEVPGWEDEWPTEVPGWEDEWPTVAPGWEDEWPTEEPIWEGTYESGYRPGVTEQEMQTADGESSEAETKKKKKDSDDDEDEEDDLGKYLMSLDCATVITPVAAVLLTLSGIGCAVILKKRED